MLVHFHQSAIFLKEVLLVPYYLVPFNALAELEAFYHIFSSELFTYIPQIFVGLSVFIIFQINADGFFVLLSEGQKSGQISSIFNIIFDFIDDVYCLFYLLLSIFKEDLNSFFNLLCIHCFGGHVQCFFMLTN